MTSRAIADAQSPVSSVVEFWNTEACGSHLVNAQRGTPEFYEEFRRLRYAVEWHIPLLVPFGATKDKAVLEIGCGNGADGAMFAISGAHYTGVDLTDAAVEATRKHFEVLGLNGRFQLENAERLSFQDESFDFVYSHGVLHHTPNPIRAFSEIYRVLKPSGSAVIMLYHKHSLNYYVRILIYMRLRVLLGIVSRLPQISSDRLKPNCVIKGIRGNQNPSIWEIHYQNFLHYGWRYLKAQNFVHHATDGPECPIAYVYTAESVRKAFRQFRSIELKTAHLPLRSYFGGWIPLSLERWLACRLGWYLFIYLTK